MQCAVRAVLIVTLDKPRNCLMTFYPADTFLPDHLTTKQFHLEPLTPAHAQRDYDALMESQAMLQLWSGSSWPSDSFTLAENAADLAWHAEEHEQRVAFTYTVLTPDRHRCLGCVYIKPLSDVWQDAPSAEIPASITRFWVTEPMLPTGLEADLLHALIDWLTSDAWEFKRVCFHTRSANTRQVALFEESRLLFRTTVELPDRGGQHRVYEVG